MKRNMETCTEIQSLREHVIWLIHHRRYYDYVSKVKEHYLDNCFDSCE